MEKELTSLAKEVLIQRNQSLAKEKELHQCINDLEIKVGSLKKEINLLQEEKSSIHSKFSKIKDEYQVLQKVSNNTDFLFLAKHYFR